MNKANSENKSSRFKRIASSRTQRVLNDLRLLGNCSNTRVYDYNKEDINKIFHAIDDAFKSTKSQFGKKSTNHKFNL